MEKRLGKIERVTAGFCGYQEAELGFQFELGADGWVVIPPVLSAWGMEPSDHCKWTKEDQIHQLGEAWLKMRDILKAAKVDEVNKLIGIPVECEFDGNLIVSWRVLEEVL